jgi:hypothetical protein
VLVFGISGMLGMKFLLQTLHRLSMAPPLSPQPDAPAPTVPAAEAVPESESAGPVFGLSEPAAPSHTSSGIQLLTIRRNYAGLFRPKTAGTSHAMVKSALLSRWLPARR